MSEPKKISEIPATIPQGRNLSEVKKIQDLRLQKEKESEKFVELWNKLKNDSDKIAVIKKQTKGLTRTEETVDLPGRMNIENEPEVVSLMIQQALNLMGSEVTISREIAEIIIDNYEGMTLQDFALFIRKLIGGKYKIYGRPNVLTFTENLDNFYKSINYNYILQKESEHLEFKRINQSRDISDYYADIKPEILE